MKLELLLILHAVKNKIETRAKQRWYYKYLPARVAEGFTLAEVLITLLVIGIVASLVIPTLIQDTQDAELATSLKKSYGTIGQALMKYKADNGNDLSSLFPVGQPHTYTLDQLAPYLSIAKNCGTGPGCWAKETKGYRPSNDGNGNYSPILARFDSETRWGKLVLADGLSFAVYNYSTGYGSSQACYYTYTYNKKDASGNFMRDAEGNIITATATNTMCGLIYVDVNGMKGPNQRGIDTFCFAVYSNRIVGQENVNTILQGSKLVR